MNSRANDGTADKQPAQRGKPAALETSRYSVFAKELPPITPPRPSHTAGHSLLRSPLSLRQDLSNVSWQKPPRALQSSNQRWLADGHTIPNTDSPPVNIGTVAMLFGSPLPHMPRSPQDSSAAYLGLSPHQIAAKSGIFSPGAFQSLFQSPSGATLDDSPFQSLSRPPAKHSPVSAAAQYSAAQASRQASVGQAQAQRMEQQHSTAGAADTKDHIAGMLVPVSAPAVSMANEQVPYGLHDSTFAERMPSFTSMVCGPPPKRQRCLKFDSMPEQDHSSQEYSSQSPSISCSQQESHSNIGLHSQSQLRTSSTSLSEQVDGPNDSDPIKEVSLKTHERPSHHHQSGPVRSSSRHDSAALPALAAAMGSKAPDAAGSAVSAAAAAAAAAVTPVTSRHMSSQSGEEASQSVLHPDTPGDAIAALSDRRLSTSSTRYRRTQHSAASGPKRCNCKKSKCLKLYCDCFAAGIYCQNCSCSCCMNTEENKDLIMMTREQIIQRNPQAFEVKISKQRAAGAEGTPGQHLRGCNCKKSHCKKKYCECFQAGVPCGPQCKCCDCHNCTPAARGAAPRPPPSNPPGLPTAAQQAAHGQGPAKTSPGTPAVRAASLGPEDGALHRPAPRQVSLAQNKKEDSRPSAAPTTRRRDPRGKRSHHQSQDGRDGHALQMRSSHDVSESGWGTLSRSMSEGAAAQAWAGKSPNTEVLTDAPVMDTALPISPLDAQQGRIKQEDHQELHMSHGAAEIGYQGHEERYMYRRHDSSSAAFAGSYSQLLTGHSNSSMVLVPCKTQPDQQDALELSMHRGSGAYDAMEPQRTSAGSAAPEPYQILMPVQMADGQMTALPPDQAQFAPGTLLVPRSNASTHLDMAMQFDQHSIFVEQQPIPPPPHGHPYISNDSILLQHYAEMAPMGDATHMHAPTSFDMCHGTEGNQLMISNDEEDLEQLIKGGPFELGLYADKLSSHMFGTESVAQSGTGFSPSPVPWQTASQQPQQQVMRSPVLQPLHHPHQQLDQDEHIHPSFQIHRARRTPTGASPSPGTYGSPGHDLGAGKPMVSKPPSTTPDNLRLCSMSVDLERADVYDACDAYPASPSDQQAWTHMNKLPPPCSSGFLRLNSGIKTVFSPNQ